MAGKHRTPQDEDFWFVVGLLFVCLVAFAIWKIVSGNG